MKVKNLDQWNELVTSNQDWLGKRMIKFIESWADAMEIELDSKEVNLADIVLSTSLQFGGDFSNTQISYAAQMLDFHWMHGGNIRAILFKQGDS